MSDSSDRGDPNEFVGTFVDICMDTLKQLRTAEQCRIMAGQLRELAAVAEARAAELSAADCVWPNATEKVQ